MNLQDAISYINAKELLTSDKNFNLHFALQMLNAKNMLCNVSEQNLSILHAIEQEMTQQSIAAVNVLDALHRIPSQLEILHVFYMMQCFAKRRDPQASLDAFMMIVKSCPKQITAPMIAFLRDMNAALLVDCSSEIERRVNLGIEVLDSTSMSRLFGIFYSPTKEINIRQIAQTLSEMDNSEESCKSYGCIVDQKNT